MQHYPYYLTYFNPLSGGNRSAPQVLLVGWGEGLEKAADWLNQQPDPDTQHVISWYACGPLSFFLDGEAQQMLPTLACPGLMLTMSSSISIRCSAEYPARLPCASLRSKSPPTKSYHTA